jgi:peptidyl-prolyl cis-trans isomerase SurA
MILTDIKMVLIYFFLFTTVSLNALENKILFKINNEIVTTVDVYNEITYLKILNPKINDLTEEKIYEISKNSIIREKIKELEITKNFKNANLDNKYLNELLVNYSKKMGFVSFEQFKNYIKSKNLSIKNIEKKIKLEVLWNQLIIKKFINEVKIDKKKIEEDLKKNNKQIEYLLSEIVFSVKNKNILSETIDIIKKDIENKGFANAAVIHSISDTSSNGGNIGWIKKTSLNSKIINEIEKIQLGSFTDPIVVPGGFLILKIDDQRLTDKDVDIENEIKLVIQEKSNEQLNQFSIIYFNKVKKDIQINEL